MTYPSGDVAKPHFAAMDGLRGIAAMAIMLFHSYKGGGIVRNGPLAVDLFFMLSGFVIGYSYDDKLRGAMLPLAFLKRRAIRLYPMIIFGALGGIVLSLIHNRANPTAAYPLHSILSSGALSLLVLPYLVPGVLGIAIFSFNPPLWSLFFELLANLGYALTCKRLSVWLLACMVLASLVWIGCLGSLGGGAEDNIIGGVPRVIAGFFGGVLLFKLWAKQRLPPIRINFVISAAGCVLPVRLA